MRRTRLKFEWFWKRVLHEHKWKFSWYIPAGDGTPQANHRKCKRCGCVSWYWWCVGGWLNERPDELTHRGPEMGQKGMSRIYFISERTVIGIKTGAKWI